MEIRNSIRAFITNHLTGGDDLDFADEDDIFKLGFVNSLFAVQLLGFVETTFDIQIENDEIELSNFSSVAAIERFVNHKRSQI